MKETFTASIFGMDLSHEDILQINPLPVSVEGLLINQPIIEAPLNHNTSRAFTEYEVVAIMVEVALYPLSHYETIESGQTTGRVHMADIYSYHYV